MPIIVRYSGSSGPPAAGDGGERGPAGGRGRPPASAIALAVVALGVGALLLAFGLVLLAAVAAVGVVGGGAVLLYHRITGRLPKFLHVSGRGGTLERGSGLDPSREVLPDQPGRRELPRPTDED